VIATIELPPERTSFSHVCLRQIETLRMNHLLVGDPRRRIVRSAQGCSRDIRVPSGSGRDNREYRIIGEVT
jgi:hypothetical protein